MASTTIFSEKTPFNFIGFYEKEYYITSVCLALNCYAAQALYGKKCASPQMQEMWTQTSTIKKSQQNNACPALSCSDVWAKTCTILRKIMYDDNISQQ